MSITSASPVTCAVHLTHERYYAGDAVEGALVIDAASPFELYNAHLKIVGKEEVHALVDQVKQSKLHNVQFGISSQDYVYYREIITLAGPLLTQKAPSAAATPADVEAPRNGGATGEPAVRDDARLDAAQHTAKGSPAGDDNMLDCLLYNESVCACPEMEPQNRSFIVSQVAAAEGVNVRFPAGHFVYPFRFLLPASLPPSYNTGIHVKDGQYSNSQAALHYYVKVYVWAPNRKELASARADFKVGAMQPPPRNRSITETAPMRESSKAEMRRGGSKSALVTDGAGVSGKTVACTFPVLGSCSCFDTGSKLKVRLTLETTSLQIGRDGIRVRCEVDTNTSGKPLRGLKVALVQVLQFETSDGRVTTRGTSIEHEIVQSIAPGKSDTMAGSTAALPVREDLVPTMRTAGLEVRYVVRVDLLAAHVDQAFYEFEGVELTGAVLAGALPPVGEMRFAALPRGRLSQREAY